MSVAILMGSDSDLDVVSKAFDVLDGFDVKYTKNVLSAHRTPAEVLNLVNNAESSGIKVFIAAALPGKLRHGWRFGSFLMI